MSRSHLLILAVATTVTVDAFSGTVPDPNRDPRFNQFRTNLAAYVKLGADVRAKNGGDIPKQATPEQVEKHQAMLAAAMQQARASAKPGDVFTPEGRAAIIEILKPHFAGPKNSTSRAVARQGNPAVENEVPGEAKPTLRVNARYPKSASVSTVSPAVLLSLPKLPGDLQYRFVGQALVLVDSTFNIIIDYIPGAIPAL